MGTDLVQLNRNWLSASTKYIKEEQDWNRRKAELKAEVDVAKARYETVVNSPELDLDRIDVARKIIHIHYDGRGLRGEDMSVVIDAITDAANDFTKLRNGYFGTKNYDGYVHQRSDHSYRHGPRHGSIVFSIGLRDVKAEIDNKNSSDCIYYLEMFKQGKLEGLFKCSR